MLFFMDGQTGYRGETAELSLTITGQMGFESLGCAYYGEVLLF